MRTCSLIELERSTFLFHAEYSCFLVEKSFFTGILLSQSLPQMLFLFFKQNFLIHFILVATPGFGRSLFAPLSGRVQAGLNSEVDSPAPPLLLCPSLCPRAFLFVRLSCLGQTGVNSENNYLASPLFWCPFVCPVRGHLWQYFRLGFTHSPPPGLFLYNNNL